MNEILPLEPDRKLMLSKLIKNDSFEMIDQSRDASTSLINQLKNGIYFATQAKLNETAMFEYGLKKGTGDRAYSGDKKKNYES